MQEDQSKKTAELIKKLAELRANRKEVVRQESSDALVRVSQKIDAEILKISEELKASKMSDEDVSNLTDGMFQ